ncbi:DNA-binding protein, partial [Phocaeicola vulgatus]
FTISGKVYYKASDVREFIKERFSVTTLRQFEKEHCTKKKK